MTELHQDSLGELKREIDAITCEWCCKGFILENSYHKIYCDPNRPEGYGRKCESKADELLPLFDRVIAESFGEVAWKLTGKAFPMTPRDEAEACVTVCDVQEVFRALSPASARRQLQLGLINRAIEEAEWWQKLTGLDILSECDIPGCQSCARMTSLKSQRTQLESEIAALEAQQARETP